MDRDLIAWDAQPRELAADPAATLLLDRSRWEAHGARFASYENELGGSTAIATGVAMDGGLEVAFAVLDDGEPTAYLLVAGSYKEHEGLVDVVLDALSAEGTITPEDILERLPTERSAAAPEPTTRELEHKLALLAGEVTALQSQLAALTVGGGGTTADAVEAPTFDSQAGRNRVREEEARREQVTAGHALSARDALAGVAPDSDVALFLSIASAELVGSWASRLLALPSPVGERAYDLAMDTIMRRARNGVEAFKDERGRLASPRIVAYVSETVGWKTKAAFAAQRDERELPLWYADLTAVNVEGPSEEERRERDAESDAMMQRARQELRLLEQRARELDARRLRQLEQLLSAYGVKERQESVVLARAARRWRIELTSNGLEVRYEPPDTWREIALHLGESPDTARKLYARVMHQLPDEARRLLEPAVHVGDTDVDERRA